LHRFVLESWTIQKSASAGVVNAATTTVAAKSFNFIGSSCSPHHP